MNKRWPLKVYMGAHSCSTTEQSLTKEDIVRKKSICEGAELRGVSKVYNAKSFKCSRAPGYRGCQGDLVGSDISILKLDEPVQFTYKIRPICLPANPSLEEFENKTAVVAGWGYYDQSSISSTIPREAEVTVLMKKVCLGCSWNLKCVWTINGVRHTRKGWGNEYNHGIHICTTGVQEPWQGPRSGDSGSALNLKENGRSSLYLFMCHVLMCSYIT